jgi:hypothetical protein
MATINPGCWFLDSGRTKIWQKVSIELGGGSSLVRPVAWPVTWPLAAVAQQAQRMRRIGVLLGYAEGDPTNSWSTRFRKLRNPISDL